MNKRKAGRPRIDPAKKRNVLSVSIPESLIIALRNRATPEQGTSAIVEKALINYLDIRS